MKKGLVVLLLLFLLAAGVAFYAYQIIFAPSVVLDGKDHTDFFVRSEDSFSDMITSLSTTTGVSESNLSLVSKLMKFDTPRPGRYLISNEMSTKALLSCLRSGRQLTVELTFNNLRKIENLAGAISKKVETDSLTLLNYFRNEKTLEKYDVTKEELLSLFIPNTYEIYWNSSPEKIMARLYKEREKFFNKDRVAKAKKIGLTKSEVYTLASIVEKETLVREEKPRVAGVYINRLRRGQLLQADPTVVYANGDFDIKRVLNKHLEKDSPYNTYKYEGLPPGPIYMPDVHSIDAVLNYEKHKYLYFCAAPNNSGRHQFARSLIEHNRNADKYRAFLNKNRIFR